MIYRNEFNVYYHVFIASNPEKTILRAGITGGLSLWQEKVATDTECSGLLYWECFIDPGEAIRRTEVLNKLSFKRKKKLITSVNPGWVFFNDKISFRMGSMDEVLNDSREI